MTEINVQRSAATTKKFSKIEIGDLFSDPDYPQEIYQKTIEVKGADCLDEEEILNAVLIAGDETGNIVHFDDDESIIPIKTATISY